MKRFILICVLMGCCPKGDLDIEWIEEGRTEPTIDLHFDFDGLDDRMKPAEIPFKMYTF